MKIAVVINVAPGAESLARAVRAQDLMLEGLGSRLHSIRLAVPHLLKQACLGAIADEPDFLAVAGGPRALRRAGQIAHEHGTPIVFLPGAKTPAWAARLWGSRSLEQMIAALAKGELVQAGLAAGSAGGQIFFGSACCGAAAQVAQLRESLEDIERFADGWMAAGRAAGLVRQSLGRGLRLTWDDDNELRAAAVDVTAQAFGEAALHYASGTQARMFRCAAWNPNGPVAHLGSLVRAAAGAEWRDGAQIMRFDCRQLRIDAGKAAWLLLDGDAMCFPGPVDIRFLPNAVQTLAFAPASGKTSSLIRLPQAPLIGQLRTGGRRASRNAMPPVGVAVGNREVFRDNG